MMDSVFSNDSPLRVRRVRTYRVPLYPSHTDPDPTTHPEPVPYPWKSSVAAALLALGDAGCEKKEVTVSESPAPIAKEVTPPKLDLYDQVVAEVLRDKPKGDWNPFAQGQGFSNLPFVPSEFGTGAAVPLDGETARELITRLFAAEGLRPQSATFTEKDFTASAQYDAEKRIGYIIADEGSLAGDALNVDLLNVFRKVASSERKPSPAEEKEWLQLIDEMSVRLVGQYGLTDEQRHDLESIHRLESLQAKAQGYLALNAKLDEPKLSMAEIRQAEKMAREHQRYLAIVSVFDRRFQMFLEERRDAIEVEAKKRTFGNSTDRSEWVRQQRESSDAEMQREQLLKLAQSVREYIAWARRSGLQ